MTLRTRLVVGLLVLLTGGLVAGNVATYRALQSFLEHRVDEQLADSRNRAYSVLQRAAAAPALAQGEQVEIPSVTYAELRPDRGPTVRLVVGGMPIPHVGDVALGYSSVESSGDGPRYRVLANRVTGGTLIVAASLQDTAQTLRRLLATEVVVSAAVLGLVAASSLYVVRVGLRPLEAMAETADAIAEGDLTRRVAVEEQGAEVARLGAALNTMLGRIEGAFAERRESEERLRRFVADASHELRTPLTSIRGYAELFRRGASDNPEDLQRAMRRIEEESDRMGVLVEDLLLLARLDQRRPLEAAPVDLAAIAVDAVADAVAVDQERTYRVDAAPAPVLGDDARLRQVATNLLANARTHTPPGTAVRVRTSVIDGTAVLEVSDDGPGIPPEEATRVFERFYRADPSRTGGGSGLGLSIVAAIAEASGGRAVVVPSTGGQGATFRIELPAVSGEASTAGEAAPGTATPA